MSEPERHAANLISAELQFCLASAVRLASTLNRQPLDLPIEWVHGKHRVSYEEIALREDEADYAASILHHSATYLMAVAIRDAIVAVVPDPKRSPDIQVRSAYQIARLIRNAFAHSPFSPIWSIDTDCRDMTFAIPDLIELNTTGLHGTRFDWRQYGGPLALFRLCRFVRTEILKAPSPSRKSTPRPRKRIRQQGDIIFEQVDKLPPGAIRIEATRADGGIDLGEGYVLYGEACAVGTQGKVRKKT
jgi:hypothetical protein